MPNPSANFWVDVPWPLVVLVTLLVVGTIYAAGYPAAAVGANRADVEELRQYHTMQRFCEGFDSILDQPEQVYTNREKLEHCATVARNALYVAEQAPAMPESVQHRLRQIIKRAKRVH